MQSAMGKKITRLSKRELKYFVGHREGIGSEMRLHLCLSDLKETVNSLGSGVYWAERGA